MHADVNILDTTKKTFHLLMSGLHISVSQLDWLSKPDKIGKKDKNLLIRLGTKDT